MKKMFLDTVSSNVEGFKQLGKSFKQPICLFYY
jgi:hypothetical protein